MAEKSGISFKFSKNLKPKKLGESKLNEVHVREEATEFVLSLEDKEVKSTKPKEEKKEYIIPLIRKNNWQISQKTETKSVLEKEGEDTSDKAVTLNELAVKELLSDSATAKNNWSNRDIKKENMVVPLLALNKIPEGYETDDKLDVSLRPDISSLEDYEQMPVEEYGVAMLKGMGWKPGDPIGNKNKQCVQPVEIELRPKGLGLGADRKVVKNPQNKDTSEKESLVLLKGAYVSCTVGKYKGLYGEIEGLDEDNARVVIKFSISGDVISLPEHCLKVVSKKEFKKESKILNRETYEQYKNGESSDEQHKKKYRDSKQYNNGNSSDELRKKKHSKHYKNENSSDEQYKSRDSKQLESEDSSDEQYNRKHRDSKQYRNSNSSHEQYKKKHKDKKHESDNSSDERYKKKHRDSNRNCSDKHSSSSKRRKYDTYNDDREKERRRKESHSDHHSSSSKHKKSKYRER